MKTSNLLLAVLALSLLSMTRCDGNGRGVRRLIEPTRRSTTFDPRQSAAVFVGIQRFTTDPRVARVPYAVDDAVDLAYALAVERNASLVPAQRVVLALSGEPYKMESKERLKTLRAEGAAVVPADRENLLGALERQAKLVGADGIFIASFATHGFSSDGVPYVLASTSLLNSPQTSISTASVLETIGTSKAGRSLVFIDACRERLQAATRATGLEVQSSAPLIREMKRISGQVVLYAATAGNYAYDDDRARNGVFTSAILDGLRCKAEPDARGLITVEALAAHAEKHVARWFKRRGKEVASAIQISTDGNTKLMPLASCGVPATVQPARAAIHESTLTAFGRDGMELWRREVQGEVIQREVADLDGDGDNEVIVATGSKIVVFRASGEPWWSTDTNAPDNYGSMTAANLSVRTFLVAALTAKTKRIVALSNDAGRGYPSRVSVFLPDGRLEGGYWHPGHLRQVTLSAPTARHKKLLIIAGDSSVFLFDPKNVGGEAPPYRGKLGTGTHLWYGILTTALTIDRLETIDVDNDGTRDIAIRTSDGEQLHLDFEGKLLGPPSRTAHFQLLAGKKRPSLPWLYKSGGR